MFFVFGWGRKVKSWSLGDGRTLMATWEYFSLFFCPIAGSITWHLLSENRSEDRIINYETVEEMLPEGTPQVNLWHRFGLLFVIGALFLFIMLSS